MLLVQGKIIYFNEANKAQGYFSEIGYPCPPLSNPADHFMSIMSIESIDEVDTDDIAVLKRSQTTIFHQYV